MKTLRSIAAVLVLSIVLTSCSSKKEVVYFNDAAQFETIVEKAPFDTKIKVDDILDIHVSTLDPETSAPFNLYRMPGEGMIGQAQQVDYLVDKNGEIDFPVIGKLKVAGLSPAETRELLQEKLTDYLVNPIINIRIRNFTVTILGAVNRPGTYTVNGEQITILEALGLAGDINIKGRKDNILVIREFEGTKVYNHINLNNKSALSSPYYYLTQNDVVYVEPNRSGKTASSLDQRASIAVSIISVLITSTVVLLTRN